MGDTKISSGRYSVTHNGINIDIDVSEYQTLDNIVNKLNGLSINLSERIKSQTKAVSDISIKSSSLGTVRNNSPLNPIVLPEYSIYADESGLRIGSNTALSWQSMGLDIENPIAGTYTFHDTQTPLSFEFKIEAGATKESVIKGLDNVKINVREGDKYYDSATTWFGTDSCSLNLYDKINGMTQTSPFKYSMNDYIPGVGNRILQGCFELSTDDNNNPMLKFIGTSMVGGTPDSKHNFYMTRSDIVNLKNMNYSLPYDEQTSPKFEFKNSKGNSIYMYLNNNGAGSYDEVLEDFKYGYKIGFGCMGYDAVIWASSATSNSIENGNVGKITYETFIDTADSILLNNQEVIDISNPTPTTPPTPEKPETKNGCWWIQSGSEAGQGMWLEIDPMNTSILGINDLDVSTVDGANHAIDAVQGALDIVSSSRSKIGAQQNRLEHTISNNQNNSENTTAAESRIRDTDIADEMVKFSKESILENVGQAMLAQSNQFSQNVLSLLQ